MTINAIATLLEGVRKTGNGRLSARCPAHKDKSPSLSVREGHRGILIHCFAGCSLKNICEAIGIQVRELFFDSFSPPDREAFQLRKTQRALHEKRVQVRGLHIDALREAEKFLKATEGTDINCLPEIEFDTLMNDVCNAYTLLIAERDLSL